MARIPDTGQSNDRFPKRLMSTAKRRVRVDLKTILVVEDDDVTRAGFGMVLTDHGYMVGLAANGQEALDYVQGHGPPDLIVLDMLLPGVDGWHFLKPGTRGRPLSRSSSLPPWASRASNGLLPWARRAGFPNPLI